MFVCNLDCGSSLIESYSNCILLPLLLLAGFLAFCYVCGGNFLLRLSFKYSWKLIFICMNSLSKHIGIRYGWSIIQSLMGKEFMRIAQFKLKVRCVASHISSHTLYSWEHKYWPQMKVSTRKSVIVFVSDSFFAAAHVCFLTKIILSHLTVPCWKYLSFALLVFVHLLVRDVY